MDNDKCWISLKNKAFSVCHYYTVTALPCIDVNQYGILSASDSGTHRRYCTDGKQYIRIPLSKQI